MNDYSICFPFVHMVNFISIVGLVPRDAMHKRMGGMIATHATTDDQPEHPDEICWFLPS